MNDKNNVGKIMNDISNLPFRKVYQELSQTLKIYININNFKINQNFPPLCGFNPAENISSKKVEHGCIVIIALQLQLPHHS